MSLLLLYRRTTTAEPAYPAVPFSLPHAPVTVLQTTAALPLTPQVVALGTATAQPLLRPGRLPTIGAYPAPISFGASS